MIVSPRCTSRAAAPLTLIVAGAALAGDRVGLEAGAVVDVDDVHLLVLADVGGLEQVGVDGDRADVVQVAVGHRRAVDLGLQHHALHGSFRGAPVGMEISVLSMRRAGPTRAATATRTSASPRRSTGARACRGDERQVLGLDAVLVQCGPGAVRAMVAGVPLAGGGGGLGGRGGPGRARPRARARRRRGRRCGSTWPGRRARGRSGRRSMICDRQVEVAHEPADDGAPAGRPSGRRRRRRAPTMFSSFATTVATPWKCSGRGRRPRAASVSAARRGPSVAKPGG